MIWKFTGRDEVSVKRPSIVVPAMRSTVIRYRFPGPKRNVDSLEVEPVEVTKKTTETASRIPPAIRNQDRRGSMVASSSEPRDGHKSSGSGAMQRTIRVSRAKPVIWWGFSLGALLREPDES